MSNEMYKVVRGGNFPPDNSYSMDRLHLKIATWMASYTGILILDCDGTIRQGSHRLHLLPSQEEIVAAGDTPNIAFHRFNEAAGGDTPIESVIDLVQILHVQGYYIIVLTSCTHSDNSLTIMLNQLELWNVPYHAAVMRGKDNHLHPVDFKEQFLYDSGIVEYNGNVTALDDCIDNCNKFREYNILALQVEDYSRFNKGDIK